MMLVYLESSDSTFRGEPHSVFIASLLSITEYKKDMLLLLPKTKMMLE